MSNGSTRAFGVELPPERLPRTLDFIIEIPKGGLVKRAQDGHIEFISPLPCPFNYGSVPGWAGADGDPADVIVLGPRRARGSTGTLPVFGRARLRDRGLDDPKWVCAETRPSDEELLLVDRFFAVYALAKLAWQRRNGEKVETRYAGTDRLEDGRLVGALSGGTAKARFRRKPWR